MNHSISESLHDVPNEDAALLARLIGDQADAWRQFNALYSRLIFRCITRVTNRFSSVVGADDVEEIYGNLCVQRLAHDKRKLRSFEPERGNKLGTWIGLLATHAAWDYLRAKKRAPKVDGLDRAELCADAAPDPYEACVSREHVTRVGRVLAEFPEKDREFVELYYGHGYSPDQVAEMMGISVKTVYSKKHKIRARLVGLLPQGPLAA
jgi:RNA polymerase sigma-70 factor (ECF subfamily)